MTALQTAGESPLSLPGAPPAPRSSRLKGWVYCSVCGEGRDLRGNKARSTGMCITCLRANPPQLNVPHLCTLCGETEPSKFAIKSRQRCTACINAKHRDEAQALRDWLSAHFKALPQCGGASGEEKGGCGLKDSHVVDGLCQMCREEIQRGRLEWVFDSEEEL